MSNVWSLPITFTFLVGSFGEYKYNTWTTLWLSNSSFTFTSSLPYPLSSNSCNFVYTYLVIFVPSVNIVSPSTIISWAKVLFNNLSGMFKRLLNLYLPTFAKS